jgi:hypothetical protein
MKFHNIQMVGPFYNENLSALPTFNSNKDIGRVVAVNGELWVGLNNGWARMQVNDITTSLPTFDPNTDQGRFISISDGTLWYGTDTEWQKVTFNDYLGSSETLPTFDPNTDQGRLIYESDTDKLWYGTDSGWLEVMLSGGTSEHNDLAGRSVSGAHPISSITGLEDRLSTISPSGYITHNDTISRDVSGAHPIDAITGLREELDNISISIPSSGATMDWHEKTDSFYASAGFGYYIETA